MNVQEGTHLEKYVELLQLINTEGSLCNNSSDLKHNIITLVKKIETT